MSKPESGLFHGTSGLDDSDTGYAKPMQSHVTDWAVKEASKLEKISKSQRMKFNTACVVFDKETGDYYYGRNAGIKIKGDRKNPILFGDDTHIGLLPKESLNQYEVGNCAEVDAVNQALNHGAKLENLYIRTIHTTSGNFGSDKRACENCTFTFEGRVADNYSGWYK